jgi:hypothetical protein
MSKSKVATEVFTRDELLALPTKSAQIRFLFGRGIKRSEIALILNIRYQHVRNVLVTELKKS